MTTDAHHHDTILELVQRQLDAYNAHDIEAFAACYDSDVTLLDLKSGEVTNQGIDSLRQAYGDLFARAPHIHAEVIQRQIVGDVVCDRERITGLDSVPIEGMAIYQVDVERDKIVRAWFVTV